MEPTLVLAGLSLLVLVAFLDQFRPKEKDADLPADSN